MENIKSNENLESIIIDLNNLIRNISKRLSRKNKFNKYFIKYLNIFSILKIRNIINHRIDKIDKLTSIDLNQFSSILIKYTRIGLNNQDTTISSIKTKDYEITINPYMIYENSNVSMRMRYIGDDKNNKFIECLVKSSEKYFIEGYIEIKDPIKDKIDRIRMYDIEVNKYSKDPDEILFMKFILVMIKIAIGHMLELFERKSNDEIDRKENEV